MKNTGLIVLTALALPPFASPQVPPKAIFDIHVSKIKRVKDGCTVAAESAQVRFTLSSEQSGACGMLKAGESYKAFRAGVQGDPEDRTNDSTILVIYNKAKDVRGDMAGFDIDSEEVIPKAGK